MTYILLALFILFAYYFTTRLVLPIYFTTKRVKEQFKNMRAQQEAYNQASQQQTPPKESPEAKVGEYIEFEEVK